MSNIAPRPRTVPAACSLVVSLRVAPFVPSASPPSVVRPADLAPCDPSRSPDQLSPGNSNGNSGPLVVRVSFGQSEVMKSLLNRRKRIVIIIGRPRKHGERRPICLLLSNSSARAQVKVPTGTNCYSFLCAVPRSWQVWGATSCENEEEMVTYMTSNSSIIQLLSDRIITPKERWWRELAALHRRRTCRGSQRSGGFLPRGCGRTARS
mmetsp:Transcript_5268/g.12749  ORF Transcript_5268/g.12749 Transcript_5268/m.12749 type:complete len:208 (+) Transcript_5268:588-1211(+)